MGGQAEKQHVAFICIAVQPHTCALTTPLQLGGRLDGCVHVHMRVGWRQLAVVCMLASTWMDCQGRKAVTALLQCRQLLL
jgi:hypothetical protein